MAPSVPYRKGPQTTSTRQPFLIIPIIFDGDQKNLDPSWTVRMFLLLNPELEKLGITAHPDPSFIEKSEWEDPAYAIPDWEYGETEKETKQNT